MASAWYESFSMQSSLHVHSTVISSAAHVRCPTPEDLTANSPLSVGQPIVQSRHAIVSGLLPAVNARSKPHRKASRDIELVQVVAISDIPASAPKWIAPNATVGGGDIGW